MTIRVLGVRSLTGPSILGDGPASCLSLAVSVEDQACLNDGLPGVRAHLAVLMPDLDPACQHRLVDLVVGLAHWALAQLGAAEGPFQVHRQGQIFHLLLPGLNTRLETWLLLRSLSLVRLLYPASARGLFPVMQDSDPGGLVQEMLTRGRQQIRKDNTLELIRILRHRGVQWLMREECPEQRERYQMGFGRWQSIVDATTPFHTSAAGIGLSLSKRQTRQWLDVHGLPVTEQHPVPDLDRALSWAARLQYPVVLKVEYGALGDQVHPNLANPVQLKAAWTRIQQAVSGRQGKAVLIEKHVPGDDYRLMVVNGRLIWAIRRTPPMVTGDGVLSVRALVQQENRNPLRGDKDMGAPALVRLRLDQEALLTLDKQGLTLESIPSVDQPVRLRDTANWSKGGRFEDHLDRIHPDNVRLAETVAEHFGMPMIGIDVMTTDISQSWTRGGLRIIEVNHSPGIVRLSLPEGGSHSLAESLLRAHAPEVFSHRVPVLLFCGRQASPVCARAAGLVQERGLLPLRVDDEGVFAGNDIESLRPAAAWPEPSRPGVIHPRAEAVLAVWTPAQLVHQGLGAAGADVMVLTCMPATVQSPIFPDGVSPARLLSWLSSCGVTLVLNADDPALLRCAADLPEDRVLVVRGLDAMAKSAVEMGLSIQRLSGPKPKLEPQPA
jgi:cyanophycin synthetase